MKRDFLTKKGLTNAEIELAFSKVSQANPFQQIKEKMESPQSLVKQQQMPLVMPQSSFSTKLRDLLNILLLIGGASYGMRYLWKKYISPWLFGPSKPVKTPHELVLETEETEVGPDLVADTMDIAGADQEDEKESHSANVSTSASEIEMINADSQENSSEDGH